MDLSKIKNELQQLIQLVGDWHEKGVDELERDLVLGKLRDIYSDIRFGATPQPKVIAPQEPSEPAESQSEEVSLEDLQSIDEELPIGVAISLDEVFEGFIPEELIPESVMQSTEEPSFEESAESEPEPETTIEEEPMPAEEQEAFEEEVATESYEESEEPKDNEESETSAETEYSNKEAENTESADYVTVPAEEFTQQPEIEDKKEVEKEPEKVVEQPSLFGDEEIIVTRVSRRAKMMSLYDDEPATLSTNTIVTPLAESPKPQPQQQVEEQLQVQEEPKELEPTIVSEEAPVQQEPATTSEPVEIEEPKEVEPYTEPQIEVAITTPALSAVPESEPVLGEVIKSNVQTIADTIKPKNTAAEQIAKGAIDDLGKAIGINDRFLLIRDLFWGSSEEYERVVAQLNGFDNFEDCMIYIVENFDWNPNSDGAKLMMELLERKYS